MFEEEKDNKIYNLIITQGIDSENEYLYYLFAHMVWKLFLKNLKKKLKAL